MNFRKVAFAALLAALPAAAQAALVDVSFSGSFSTGESLTGSLSYETAANPSNENFVEFYDLIKSFSVTSTKFIETNGTDTLSAISTGLNTIRYGSGDLDVSPTTPGFNYIEFQKYYSEVGGGFYGYLPFFGVGLTVPAYSFSASELPSAFSFQANDTVQIYFNYSYNAPNGYQEQLGANITSITAAPASVPEPATWAMMVGGFGLLGATMRQRRKAAVTFA